MEFSFSEHIVLENESALIRPMEPEDFAGLSKIAYDYEIWRFNVSRCMNDEEMRNYISGGSQAQRGRHYLSPGNH